MKFNLLLTKRGFHKVFSLNFKVAPASLGLIWNIIRCKLSEYLPSAYVSPVTMYSFEIHVPFYISRHRIVAALVQAVDDTVPIVAIDEIPYLSFGLHPCFNETHLQEVTTALCQLRNQLIYE